MAAQVRARAEALLSFSPPAVERGCQEWARTQSAWPSVAKLRAMVEEQQSLIASRQAQQALPDPNGESFLGRMRRLLGDDQYRIGSGTIALVLSLKADHQRMSDAELERELRWIIEHGYRWRPAPKPIDDAARARIAANLRHIRSAMGEGGMGGSLIAIGEAMLERGEFA